MHTKLTLRVESVLIHRAKAFAKKTGKSVSQLVAEYFALLERPPKRRDVSLTPLVRSLKGALRGTRVQDYRRYLEEKHR